MKHDQLITFVRTILTHMGLEDHNVLLDEGKRHVHVEIPTLKEVPGCEHIPELIMALNHLVQRFTKQHHLDTLFFDINGYRQERERIIVELAKRAGNKVRVTGAALALPSMNSYERHLVHDLLTNEEGVVTESMGSGAARHVVIKPGKTTGSV